MRARPSLQMHFAGKFHASASSLACPTLWAAICRPPDSIPQERLHSAEYPLFVFLDLIIFFPARGRPEPILFDARGPFATPPKVTTAGCDFRSRNNCLSVDQTRPLSPPVLPTLRGYFFDIGRPSTGRRIGDFLFTWLFTFCEAPVINTDNPVPSVTR